MDLPDHTAEVLHADVESSGLSKHAVVEGSLVLLSVLGRVTDGAAVLVLSVALPHLVNGLLASQEVVGVLEEHASVAHVHADLEVATLTVAVTQ